MDFHSALKTEEIASVDASGTQLKLVKLVQGRERSTLTLHANPTSFSTYGLQTTDVLSILGFQRSACPFMVGGQCYAKDVADDFNINEFARVFPIASKALIEAERLLLDCGLTIGTDEGWGYFFGKPSSRRTRDRSTYGDGHTSPKTDFHKNKTDKLFNYVFTFIQGGRDKGWVTHIWPVNRPLSPEHQVIFKMLGLKNFSECPQREFEPCWWFFTPFEKRGDSFFDSNTEYAHRAFDKLETNFSPAVEKIVLAHKAFIPFDMPILRGSRTPNFRESEEVKHIDLTSISPELPKKAAKETPKPEPAEYEYDIALSYASENIDYPERLAELLQAQGVKVFFDKKFEVELWGVDLYQHFSYVFKSAARYCIIFASEYYAKKIWTSHELQAAQARALEERGKEYILPVRLDDIEIPGLLPTIKYIDARLTSIEQLAEMVIKKLKA